MIKATMKAYQRRTITCLKTTPFRGRSTLTYGIPFKGHATSYCGVVFWAGLAMATNVTAGCELAAGKLGRRPERAGAVARGVTCRCLSECGSLHVLESVERAWSISI